MRGGLPALAERSHRPKACPHQIDPRVEGRIVTLRQGHPSWGPIRIRAPARTREVIQVPSHMAHLSVLVRHHLIEPRNSASACAPTSSASAAGPWSCGRWTSPASAFLDHGTECKVLTGVDDHSLFLGLRRHHGPGHGSAGLRLLRPDVVDLRVHRTFLEIWDGSELVKTVMRTSKGWCARRRPKSTKTSNRVSRLRRYSFVTITVVSAHQETWTPFVAVGEQEIFRHPTAKPSVRIGEILQHSGNGMSTSRGYHKDPLPLFCAGSVGYVGSRE